LQRRKFLPPSDCRPWLDAVADNSSSKPTRGRWVILFLISMMYLICYMDRSNISVAQPEVGKAFGLDKTSMGLVLSAFTWAYAAGQIPAGWLGDRFGPKKVLTAIMSWWSVAAVMTGAATGMTSLFSARLLLGLGEAGAFPVGSRGMQLWFPRSERGRIQGTTHFFSRFAVAVTPFVAGTIILAFGWRAIFYIFGSLGVIWSIVFSWYYRNRPEEHKSVNQAELAEIRGLNPDGSIKPLVTTQQSTPWKRILGSPNMWYIALGYSCFFFGTNFYLTWYPTYLREHRNLTLQTLGIIGSVPLFAGMAGDLIGGTLSDLMFKRMGKARFARSIVAAPGFLLSGIFLIPAAMTESAWTSVLCLATSFFFLEFVIGPAWAVAMDVGGQFSGTVSGVMLMAGALAASITPLVFGYYFGKGSWTVPFFITSGVMLLGALIWAFLINPERSVVQTPVQSEQVQ
jgi:sugar phosphate permease